MINWFSVVANGFWILGLAVLLAGLSYYYWLAGQLDQPIGQVFGRPSFQRVAMIGLLLVGVGLALTGNGLWQTIPAVALIIVCLIALFGLLRSQPE